MNMSMKEFVKAVHEAWHGGPLPAVMKIVAIKYRRSYGYGDFVAVLEDKTSVTILVMDDGRIGFF